MRRGPRTGREVVQGRIARVGAIALASTALLAGTAVASPAGRGSDPVVLEGSQVRPMLKSDPGRIVAFAWKRGWRQVPVQVDERKVIDVRSLYPDPAPAYASGSGFPLEVYADPATRTGADPDPRLDSDDEVAFMARDTGQRVAAGRVARPRGTYGPVAQVAVRDPLDGNRSWLYLFRSSGRLVPSAGKSYVALDFRLLGLAPGQTIADGYGYANSNNPEDTTVETDFYSLHTSDRWMDDEIRLRSGGSTGTDILDREVAQATLTSCGRTELTFSGNWNRGGDNDEGTFVAVRQGPIRVIRDYMGANSGPYTQRQQIFYEKREDTTIFLRVHAMLDLYAWTDYSAAAIGMTYRNQMNPDGVEVDGSPDDLTPTTTSDFADGSMVWEQLAGPQGSLSTVYGVETDIETPNFGSYYLDDDNLPLTGRRTQCNGDGVSYGSSGFGILGPVTPNTDPRLGSPARPANRLTVERVRYFGGPTAGTGLAAGYSERVESPLRANSASFRVRTARP